MTWQPISEAELPPDEYWCNQDELPWALRSLESQAEVEAVSDYRREPLEP